MLLLGVAAVADGRSRRNGHLNWTFHSRPDWALRCMFSVPRALSLYIYANIGHRGHLSPSFIKASYPQYEVLTSALALLMHSIRYGSYSFLARQRVPRFSLALSQMRPALLAFYFVYFVYITRDTNVLGSLGPTYFHSPARDNRSIVSLAVC